MQNATQKNGSPVANDQTGDFGSDRNACNGRSACGGNGCNALNACNGQAIVTFVKGNGWAKAKAKFAA